MENKKRDIELRSEEFSEVLGWVPPWILRWGIMVLFGSVLILLGGSYLFKYPDVVEAEITVSTQTPPAYVLSKSAGRITRLYRTNGSSVVEGDLLAMIENPARSQDVLLLKERMEQWEASGYEPANGKRLFNGQSLQLGEIQSAYASFVSILTDYANFLKLDYYQRKSRSGTAQLNSLKDYYHIAQKQQKLSEQEQVIANRIYGRDSTLYTNNAMIAAEYDVSQRSYLQSLQSRESSKMSLNQISMQIEQNKENLLDIHRQALTEEQKYTVDLQNAIEQLRVQITSWEQRYLLTAPITGKLTFMSVWSDNQNVQSGESVFVIAPAKESQPIGKALLPVQNSGKVKPGQKVNIRLNNYPDQEFGYVKGIVTNISPVPTAEGQYVVEVKLPEGLHTNYGKTLPMSREMKGSAEIVTEDLRVIERFIAPIRKLAKKGLE